MSNWKQLQSWSSTFIMIKLVLIGAGGHAKSCLGVIESSGQYDVLGFIETKFAKGEKILGYPVLGGNEEIANLAKDDVHFFIGVGQVKSPDVRVRLFELLQGLSANIIPVIKAHTAFVSQHAVIGKGTIVMHHATANTDSRIGSNVILNNHCLIEHDCVVGDHTHISTGALVNGGCTVGDRVFIGSGSVLVQGITVASDVIIGAGSVVISSIAEAGTYAGNPAKKIR